MGSGVDEQQGSEAFDNLDVMCLGLGTCLVEVPHEGSGDGEMSSSLE